MAQNYFYPPSGGGGSASNPSIGTNGTTNPTSTTQVGGKNPSNFLVPINLDASGNLLVAMTSAPLPTGGSTAARQDTGNTSLASIDSKLADGQKLMAASLAVTLASDQSALAVTGTFFQATQPISAAALPLPTGASTEATLAAASAKLPATLGQKLMAASLAVTLASDQTAVPVSQSGTWNITNVSGTVSLPTLAATSTLQATGNTSLATIATNSAATQGSVAAGTAGTKSDLVGGVFNTILPTLTNGQQASIQLDASGRQIIAGGTAVTGTAVANAPYANIYSSTAIGPGSYTQLVASTTSVINNIHIFDSSGQPMILAVGASGSEVIQAYVPPGGDTYSLNIPAGSRIAYKALINQANSGFLLMSFFQ